MYSKWSSDVALSYERGCLGFMWCSLSGLKWSCNIQLLSNSDVKPPALAKILGTVQRCSKKQDGSRSSQPLA